MQSIIYYQLLVDSELPILFIRAAVKIFTTFPLNFYLLGTQLVELMGVLLTACDFFVSSSQSLAATFFYKIKMKYALQAFS